MARRSRFVAVVAAGAFAATLSFATPASATYTNNYSCTSGTLPNGNHCYVNRLAQVDDSGSPIGDTITNSTA